MSLILKIRRELFTKGGIHPATRKETASSIIVPGPFPEQVIIPLQQHIGPVCEPIVEVHDHVLVGQKIGDSDAYVSAPVHSSVSGEVTGIVKHPHPTGRDVLAVQIVSDGKQELHPTVEPPGDPMEMSPVEIRKCIREGGIVGMGGAGFPTHVKLFPPEDKHVEIVVINGAECEPYLTGDHRLMVERGDEIMRGARIIQRAVGAGRIVVGIERNKHEAIDRICEIAPEFGAEVVILPTRYPMGAEKTLIHKITGREVPSGGLPMDVGAVVDNVGTAAAIHDVFYKGMPLVERIVTVQGDGIAGHANLMVKVGTLFRDVIEFCGGMVGKKGKLIMGGPMMGLAQYTDAVTVTKTTSGIIAMRRDTISLQEPAHFVCIRCGRCVRRCPMNLMPYLIGSYSDAGLWDDLAKLNIDDCVECGCCAYICPTKSPLVQLVKVGKEGLARRKKKMEALSAAHEGD